MKYIFLSIFLVLLLATFALLSSYPENNTTTPTLYWVTDANPARKDQVEGFQEWLVKHNHVNDDNEPAVQLKLDTANRSDDKIIIQGVSGIGGDILDTYGGTGIRFLGKIGMLDDVTEHAKANGYDVSQTYAPMKEELMVNGKQYGFPCNVGAQIFWVNKDILEEHNQPIPSLNWTVEEFEKLGKAYIKSANKPGERQKNFYMDRIDLILIYRSMGFSSFNETLTATQYNDERFIKSLRLLHKWTYEDRILPSASDIASFNSQQGYGGANLQLFYRGNYAMIQTGRYALIQLRKFGAMNLAAVRPPYLDYPNTVVGTRSAVVYVAGKHKEYAKLFLAYLASEDYNMRIVKTADALPPNPEYTKVEEFLKPKDYPNEWGCHEVFSDAANEIGIGYVYSPYVLRQQMNRYEGDAINAVMSNRMSAEKAASQLQQQVMADIKHNVNLKKYALPELVEQYHKDVELQNKIDELKKQGKKIPLSYIKNPFYRKYYQDKGMVE
ncbi:carbohydrate ABC transporter substrate-binding protein [Planctomycetota bacterium]|nr:carbohydrate ABC transporter substrate-binding protein [Planctomycetota bacterium]